MNVKRIMVAGHISLDFTPEFQNHPDRAFSDILRQGKLVNVGAAQMTLGGAVSNTGLALHRFGADVYLTAKIGKDLFGEIVQRKLEESGCRHILICDDKEDTSYTIVLAPLGSDRAFLHNPGANHSFSSADLSDDKLSDIQYFHFGYPPLMRCFYRHDGEELAALFRRLKEKNVITSLDMAAVDPRSEAGGCDWEKILSRVLPYVDFFVPSIEELCFFLDRAKYERWQAALNGADVIELLSLERDVYPLASRALELGCQCILIKCGAAGMYLRTDETAGRIFSGESVPLWENVSRFQNSFVPDHILSATGAGDTSIAAFLYAVMQNMSPRDALEYAAAAGACCVTTYDTVSGLLPFSEMRKKINAGWKQQCLIAP